MIDRSCTHTTYVICDKCKTEKGILLNTDTEELIRLALSEGWKVNSEDGTATCPECSE